jgi:hypothetical protein
MGCEHTPGLGVLPLEPCPLLFFKIECYSVFILQKKKKKDYHCSIPPAVQNEIKTNRERFLIRIEKAKCHEHTGA